jgi:hypothetical protein
MAILSEKENFTYMGLLRFTSILFFIFFIEAEKSFSQIFLLNEMPRPVYYERTHRLRNPKDWKCVGDMLHSDKALMRYDIFSGNISHNMGRVIINDSENITEVRSATSFLLRTRVVEQFYITTTFFKDWNQGARALWLADFQYSFGRYSWKPKTWSYGYENYAPNKYSDPGSTLLRNFLQGNFFIAYNNGLFQRLMEKMHVGNANFTVTPFFRYAFHYLDEDNRIRAGLGKPTMGLGMRYNIWRGLYAESAVYGYISPRHKQPWDPDYTYGFGWFDWRPFRLSFTYGNWVINRFPWNETAYPKYNFWDGNFRVIFNWAW